MEASRARPAWTAAVRVQGLCIGGGGREAPARRNQLCLFRPQPVPGRWGEPTVTWPFGWEVRLLAASATRSTPAEGEVLGPDSCLALAWALRPRPHLWAFLGLLVFSGLKMR